MRYGNWLAVLIAASMLSMPTGTEARESRFEGGEYYDGREHSNMLPRATPKNTIEFIICS